MERIEAGEPPLVFGDGDETMDMVNVRDVARANILAATAPATDVVVNIGSGEEISLYDLATRLARVMGREELSPELRPRRAINPVPRRLADIAAAEQYLDFRPTIDFDDGLFQLVAWWRRERQKNAALATGQGAR
jgi:UDP-glucose 4-epimerase